MERRCAVAIDIFRKVRGCNNCSALVLTTVINTKRCDVEDHLKP